MHLNVGALLDAVCFRTENFALSAQVLSVTSSVFYSAFILNYRHDQF